MKTLKCDICDHEASGETFEEWMNNLKPHYAATHADFMKEKMQLPEKEQIAEMGKWMETNKQRFEAA
jgi:hypothetical protein